MLSYAFTLAFTHAFTHAFKLAFHLTFHLAFPDTVLINQVTVVAHISQLLSEFIMIDDAELCQPFHLLFCAAGIFEDDMQHMEEIIVTSIWFIADHDFNDRGWEVIRSLLS